MIGNAELMERLRRMSHRLDMLDCENVLTAADRIEELVKERDEYKELYYHCFKDAASLNIHYAEITYAAKTAEAKLAKAVAALNMVDLSIMENTNETDWRLWGEGAVSGIRTVLAELEK